MHSPVFSLIFCSPLWWFQHWKIKFGLPYPKLRLVQIGSTGIPIIGMVGRNGKPFFWHLWYYHELRDTKIGLAGGLSGREGFQQFGVLFMSIIGRCISLSLSLSVCSVFVSVILPVIVRWPVRLSGQFLLVSYVLLEMHWSVSCQLLSVRCLFCWCVGVKVFGLLSMLESWWHRASL